MGAELRSRFQDALARGIEQGNAAGVDVVSGSDVRMRLSSNEELQRCTSGPCLAQVAKELRVERLALAEIAVAGKSYTFTLKLVDQGGAEIWRTVERCDICSVREADEAVGRAAARMAPWVTRPSPAEQAKAETKPAPVKQSPRPAAPAPVPPPVVSMAPRAPAPQANVSVVEHRKWTGYRYAWVISLVAGGTVAVGSVPFWYYYSKEASSSAASRITCTTGTVQSCPTIYKGNLGGALGLLISGVVVAGGGFGLFYALDQRELKRRERREAALTGLLLQPVAGGSLLGVEGRF